MHPAFVLLCLAGTTVHGSLENRQAADQAQYISAVSVLVTEYFTPPYYASVTAAVAAAASAASVPGDAGSLLVSCLAAPTAPAWFAAAVPPPLSTNLAALEAAVHSLAPKPAATGAGAGAGVGVGATTGVLTTTDAAGLPVTSTFTSPVVTGTGTGSSSSSNGAVPTGATGGVVGGLVALVGMAVVL